ncbi:MAG: LicD family protein [Lachnospiraceae bacterium]|nr:LicD family protein [uncultured Acetatifactor sp.]MCI8288102.1 LicD family protein [Lachnospiraceae bacterium]
MSIQRNRTQYCISKEELKQIQIVQQELIQEVVRICKKCRIHFNMVGGTMLGAIRHQGYIPWDDDADIGFLREEYEKFREACRTELNHEKYYMQDLRDTKGYRWGYGKLRRKGTEFIRLNQEFMPYEQGISIDLMPFDNVPDGWISQRLHFFRCFLYRKILWSKVGSQSEEKVWKRMIYKAMQCMPAEIAINSYQHFINLNRKRKTHLVRILTFPTPRGVYGYKREWYTHLSEYRFENMMLPGAQDYDGYLKVKYGSYRELPPVEKRKTHPISKLKLPEE